MHLLAFEQDTQFRIVSAIGPLAGTTFGLAEQVLFSDFEFNPPHAPGALVAGRIKAVWGLALDLSLSLNATTLHDLGIGRSFRNLSFARRCHVVGTGLGAYMALQYGGKLTGPGQMLHLGPGLSAFTA